MRSEVHTLETWERLVNWILGVLGAGLLYIAGEIVAEALVEGTALATGPIRGPIWRAFVQARWPWPAAILFLFAILCSVAGAQLLERPNAALWTERFGFILFFGGAFLALAAPALWIEARKRSSASQTAKREGGGV